jgi:hypothetical protein
MAVPSISLDDFQVVRAPGLGGDLRLRLNVVNNSDSLIPADSRLSFRGNRVFKPLDQRIPGAVKPRGELPTKMPMVGAWAQPVV